MKGSRSRIDVISDLHRRIVELEAKNRSQKLLIAETDREAATLRESNRLLASTVKILERRIRLYQGEIE